MQKCQFLFVLMLSAASLNASQIFNWVSDNSSPYANHFSGWLGIGDNIDLTGENGGWTSNFTRPGNTLDWSFTVPQVEFMSSEYSRASGSIWQANGQLVDDGACDTLQFKMTINSSYNVHLDAFSDSLVYRVDGYWNETYLNAIFSVKGHWEPANSEKAQQGPNVNTSVPDRGATAAMVGLGVLALSLFRSRGR